MKHNTLFYIVFVSLFVLSACGGGGGGSTTTASSSFSVKSTSPANGSTQKSDFPVVAIFSEPVDVSLIDSNNFSVTTGGNPVSGVFTYSVDKSVVIFTPDADLIDGSTYSVTLNTNIASAENEKLSTGKSWSFTAKDKTLYSCTVTTPPVSLGLNAYYTKYCDINGLPIVAGNLVADASLQRVWVQIMNMIKTRQDIHNEVVIQGTRIALIEDGQGLTSLPEYADFDTLFGPPFDGGTWAAVKGLAAAPEYPVTAITETNVLCLAGDVFQGENVLTHEFAHTILNMGLDFMGQEGSLLKSDLTTSYNAALAAGKYTDTYAATNIYEYLAEGVQTWFDANKESPTSPKPDGSHNDINTRAELVSYDPALHNIISRIFPADYLPGLCP